MRRQSAGLTDLGRRRAINEDSYMVDDTLGIYVVADGMGGHAAGEVASQEAVETFYHMLLRNRATIEALKGVRMRENLVQKARRVLESAVQAATYMVYGIAEHDPDRAGMGTTLSAMVLTEGLAITAQVGDSRIYLLRDGVVSQLTEDHTLVAWQVKEGIISEEEAQVSPQRNVITRAVGSKDYVQVDTNAFRVEENDRFLLCSDGLHDYLDHEEVGRILELEPERAVRRFIDLANDRGGKDNITAVVIVAAAD